MQKDVFLNLSVLTLAISIFSMYALGVLWPDTFWATHFLAFLPTTIRLGFLLLALFLLGYAFYKKDITLDIEFGLNNKTIFLISIIMSIVFYNINIVNDYYGDAKNFKPYLEHTFTGFKDGFWSDLFSIQFKTGHARWGVFNLYSAIAYTLNINMLHTFKLMGAVFGSGFVFIWLQLVSKYSKTASSTIVLIVLGCTSPVVLNFCGHIETYGFVLFLIMSWLYLFIKALSKRNTLFLWALIPLTLICIRFNTPSIILIPGLVFAFIYHYSLKNKKLEAFFTLKNIGLFVLIPLIFIGIFAYFFVFESHIDSRVLDTTTNDIDRLFLPLFSPEAPLDTYSLFSWNHISDFLMSFFFWSPGVLFLIGIIAFHKKRIYWNNPLILVLLLTLILFLGFLFMINPLMSLPMDWDLFTLPFPIILVLILLILNDVNLLKRNIWVYALSLHLLSIPAFIVLTNKTMHSYRIESVGVRVYKTYYQHADSYLLYALQMLDDRELYSLRKEQLLQKLKPFTRGNIDQNYAALLLDEGINNFADNKLIKARENLLSAETYASYLKLTHEYIEKVNIELVNQNIAITETHRKISDSLFNAGLKLSREEKQFQKAINVLKRASYYNPYNLNTDLFQMEAYFLSEKFNNALEKAEKLVEQKFPNQKQAIRFAIHCALEAESYKKALYYSNNYLSLWPDDAFIKTINQSLKSNDNVSNLKFKFAKIQ